MRVWEAFNIQPKNENFYSQAFTHKSYLNEIKMKFKSYERLEWIGDSIIQFYATRYIFKTCPHFDEGKLTIIRKNAVKTKTLSQFSKDLRLEEFILLGRSEKKPLRIKLLADIFEAFIGALFLDKQEQALEVIFKETLYKTINQSLQNLELIENAKTLFQEKMQVSNKKEIIYEVVKETGKNHNKLFHIKLRVGKMIMGQGSGKTKQDAEVQAAEAALKKLT